MNVKSLVLDVVNDKWNYDTGVSIIDKKIQNGTLERSVSGQNGSAAMMSACCLCFANAESDTVALSLIDYYNDKYCSPSWKGKELQHKIDDASSFTIRDNGSGLETHNSIKKDETVEQLDDCEKYKVSIQHYELPKIQLHGKEAALEFLRVNFNEDEIIKVGKFVLNNDGLKSIPSINLVTVRDVRNSLDNNTLEVTDFSEGFAIGINPFREINGKGGASNVSSLRHILIEMDRGTKQDQYNLLMTLGLPIDTITHSGGTGLHALIRTDSTTVEEHEMYKTFIRQVFSNYSEVKDLQVLDSSRFSRFAGFFRGNVEQELIATCLNTDKSFKQWMEEFKAKCDLKTLPYKTLSYFKSNSVLLDDNSLELVGNRSIVTQAVSVVYATAGVGKSVFGIQLMTGWALGREVLGMTPVRKIRSIMFQFEDDDRKIQSIVSGIQVGMSLSDVDIDCIGDSVVIPDRIAFVNKSVLEFLGIVEQYIRQHKPHLVILNPITAFLGEMEKRDTQLIQFRSVVDELSLRYNVHFMLISHTPKLMRNKDGNRVHKLDQFDAYGASMFAWWPRIMFAVYPTEDRLEWEPDSQLYALDAVKGGGYLNWKDASGNQRYITYMKRSTESNKPFWISCDIAKVVSHKELKTKEKTDELTTTLSLIESLVPFGEDNAITKKELYGKIILNNCPITERKLTEYIELIPSVEKSKDWKNTIYYRM